MKMGDWDSIERADGTTHLVPSLRIVTVCGVDISKESFHYTDRTVIDCVACRETANRLITA